MVSCDTVRNLISDYVENSIDPDNRSVVESHLRVCPDCRKAVQNVQYLTGRLPQLSAVSCTVAFDQNLRVRIMQPRQENPTIFSIRNLSYSFSAAVILVAAYFIFWTGSPGPVNNVPATQPSTQISGSSAPMGGSDVLSTARDEENLVADDTTRTEPAKIDQENIKLIEQ